MFPRCFAIPKEGKSKETFENKGKRWANCGLAWLRSSVLLGLISGSLGSAGGHPLRVAHYPTKIAQFRLFGAIAFSRSFQISVLRAFLGGFFGFIG